MKFYIYCIYDQDMGSFDSRLNLAPFEPQDMAEQYRRSATKMNEVQKAEADGKQVIWMGEFDDVDGTIHQDKLKIIFEYHKDKKEPEVPSQEEDSKSA